MNEYRLKQRIALNGPLNIASFMAEALSHYYGSRDPLGSQGDFTTAPEISQLFGEMVGIWCAYSWQQMGCPDRVLLVELGPGRGTLMHDILRATRHVPGFHAAIQLHLVETSPVLRHRQQEKLYPMLVSFRDSVASLPEGVLLVVANEFFDALPIHQYSKTTAGWCERAIALNAEEKLCFTHTSLPTTFSEQLASLYPEAPEGAVLETCPAATAIIRTLATRMTEHKGAALIIDYGYDFTGRTRNFHDTLQALKNHAYVPVLAAIGEADLTAHVDFTALKHAAEEAGAVTYGVISQQQLLSQLGIYLRLEQLLKHATATQQEMLRNGVERLLSPTQMGTLFKAISLTSPDIPAPIGFTL